MGRWDDLFADLEAQLDMAEAVELEAEVEELARTAWSRLAMVERWRAAHGRTVELDLGTGEPLRGRVEGVGPDWLLLLDPLGELLVPLAAVRAAVGLPTYGRASESEVGARLGLAHALRGIAADGEPVHLLRAGAPPLRALIMRVGLDHVDIADADGDMAPAAAARSVPFGAILAVRRL